MRPPTPLALLVLGLGLLASCRYEDIESPFHDGAYCDDTLTCPPDQECSPDGFCLYPCPVAGCTGSGCGCEEIDTGDDVHNRVCWADGLCHVTCVDTAGSCLHSSVCDALADECVLTCTSTGDCVNGATCQDSENLQGNGIRVCRE